MKLIFLVAALLLYLTVHQQHFVKCQENNSTIICCGLESTLPGVCNANGACTANETCACKNSFSGPCCQCAPGTQYDNGACHSIVCCGLEATNAQVCGSQGKCEKNETCQCKSPYTGACCQDCMIGYAKDASNITCEPVCYSIGASAANVCSGNGTCASPVCILAMLTI